MGKSRKKQPGVQLEIPQPDEKLLLGKEGPAQNSAPIIKLDQSKPIEQVPDADYSQYVSVDQPSREDQLVQFLQNQFPGPGEDFSADAEKVRNQTLANATTSVNSPVTPEEKVNDNIDNKALQNILTGDYSDPNVAAEKAAAAQVNSEVARTGEGNETLANLTQFAIDNPNVEAELTTRDFDNITTDLSDAYNYGDPDYDRKLSQLSSLLNKPARYAEPAIDRLGLTEYYPDMGKDIRVGGYSGSIVGNNDIYVAQGELFPHSIIDARRRALQDAAAKKARYKEKLFEMATVQGAYPYQKQLDTEIMDFNSKYGDLVNYDWDKLSPGSSKLAMEYWDGVKKIQTLGRATKEIHSKAEQLFKDMTSDGKMHVSPEQQRLISDWYMGKFKMNEVLNNPKKEREFYDLAKKMKAYDNVSYYSQEASKILKASADKVPIKIKEGLDINDPKIAKAYSDLYAAKQTNDYDMYTKALLTFVDDDRIDLAAKGLLDQHRFSIPGNDDQKLDYVKKQVLSYLGRQLDIDEKIQGIYNRQRLQMQREKHDWQKEDRITPYKTIYDNFIDVGNREHHAQLLAQGDLKGALKSLGDEIGGSLVDHNNGVIEYNTEFKPTDKDQFKTSIKNTYQAGKIQNIISNIPDAKARTVLMDLYKKNGDIELVAQPTQKNLRFAVDTGKGIKYVTKDYAASNPNWRKDAIPYSVDDIQVYAVVPKENKYGEVEMVKVPLPATRDVVKLDRNGIAEKDAKIKAQYEMFNRAKEQGAQGYMIEEGPEDEIVPDFNP